MHLLYLVIPSYKNLSEPNWDTFIRVYNDLVQRESSEFEVAELLGISLDYLYNASVNRPKLPDELKDRGRGDESLQSKNYSKDVMELVKHCRFFIALILNDLLNEVSIEQICWRFRYDGKPMNRGYVQTLQTQV